MDAFFDFCEELFPSISYKTIDSAKKAINTYNNIYGPHIFAMKPIDGVFAQGDIFESIPFLYYDNEGILRRKLSKGMLLTNTCDNERKDNLIFASMWFLEDYSTNINDIESIKNNIFYDFMYIDHSKISEYFINFNMLSTINRLTIMNNINQNKIYRILSLSDIGYFLLICKLTIFFMRYEDKNIHNKRIFPSCE